MVIIILFKILFVAQEPSPSLAEEERRNYDNEISTLRDELKQSHQLAEMYREQVLKLEDQLSRQVEQGDVTRELFKTREEKLSHRLKLSNERYKELEKRRKMEVEGFRNELAQMRDKLRSVEKRLLRTTLERSDYEANVMSGGGGVMKGVDEERVLKSIHETSSRSRAMQGELHHLKAKIYSIENDIRRL